MYGRTPVLDLVKVGEAEQFTGFLFIYKLFFFTLGLWMSRLNGDEVESENFELAVIRMMVRLNFLLF